MTASGLVWIFGPVLGLLEAYLLRFSIARLGIPGSSLYSGPRCDSCGEDMGIVTGIPIIGYLIHMGRCKHCEAKLPVQTFLMELPLVLFTIWLFQTQSWVVALEASIFAMALLGIAVADVKHFLIPNSFVLVILILALIEIGLGILSIDNALKGLGIGIVVSVFLILPQLLDKSYGEPAYGDVKLALVLGLWLGWVLAIYVFFLASLMAFLWWLIQGVKIGLSVKRRLAFGPFVALWAFVMGIGKLLDPQFVAHLMSFRI